MPVHACRSMYAAAATSSSSSQQPSPLARADREPPIAIPWAHPIMDTTSSTSYPRGARDAVDEAAPVVGEEAPEVAPVVGEGAPVEVAEAAHVVGECAPEGVAEAATAIGEWAFESGSRTTPALYDDTQHGRRVHTMRTCWGLRTSLSYS